MPNTFIFCCKNVIGTYRLPIDSAPGVNMCQYDHDDEDVDDDNDGWYHWEVMMIMMMKPSWKKHKKAQTKNHAKK